jgi:hypothetical protein
MTMRKAFALAAVSSLAVVGAAPMVSAQTNTLSTIAVNLVDAPATSRPAGVTGYSIATTCNFLQGTAQPATVTSSFAGSGTNNIQFPLTSTSSCVVKVAASGSAGAAAGGAVKITFGDPNSGPSVSGPLGNFAATAGEFTIPDLQRVAVVGNNQITVTITYPTFTVKKTVVGEEATTGFDYSMAAVCYNGATYSATGALLPTASFVGPFRWTQKANSDRVIKTSDMPGLFLGATCHVAELANGGAAATTYSGVSTTGAQAILIGKNVGDLNPFADAAAAANPAAPVFTRFVAGTSDGNAPTFVTNGFSVANQTITVTNSFVGDLLVSKVVSGDPKTNIAIYEINVSCNQGGPRETFLLKDRQSKLFTGIPTGARCNVQELRSDGAEATYSDNSGENTTDGIVTIKATASGCIDRNLSSFPDCRANVIVTNSYGAATTTAAPTTAASAAVTTAAPVAPAPVEEPEELAEEEATIG